MSEEKQDINNVDEINKNNYLVTKNDFETLKKALESKLLSKRDEFNPNNSEHISNMLDNIAYAVSNMAENIDRISYLDHENYISLVAVMVNINYDLNKINDENYKDEGLFKIFSNMISVDNTLKKYIEITKLKSYEENAKKIIEELNNQKIELEKSITENKILSEDLKNKKVNEIFEDDSEKFKSLAKRYEIAFYIALVFLFLYFFGWYIEIDTANFKFKFAEQFYGNHSATFYVQKISLLILSTTLAAFLLKRSFMNRRLADEAYRTAKELDALPRYMEGMPDEMKEKIRFDLAYKYFGNGIHHDSYTDGENLMHENIKANTEFMKIVKGVPSTTDESKADKDKNE